MTAIALRAVVYYLCLNPSKKTTMLAELDNASSASLLNKPVSYKESTTHLPYFAAVIKEAMRMHPSTGLILERHTPPEGATISGQFIPGGTIVGINSWVINYDPANFVDPNTFLPERWLESKTLDETKLRAMNDLLMFNFGAGSRSCIGRHLSLMELHKVLPELFRTFDVQIAQPQSEWRETDHWFVQQEGPMYMLRPR